MEIVSAAVPPFMKNGYLVVCEDTSEAVIVDPGDEVQSLLERTAARRAKVRAILLTHAHIDHITGVAKAKAATTAPVYLHRDDLFLYEGVVQQGLLFGMRTVEQPAVDAFFEPGTRFLFGRHAVDILHTPGHSPGGVCLAIGRPGDAESRELFVGDVLFAGSIGRTDLPGGDYDTLIRSIRTVLFRFADDAVVRPGHGPATTIGKERRSNPFLVSS